MTELPLLVIDVQRGGPSTGLPTKTEQADLLQAMFGRNGEAPVPVIAPQSPGDCFDADRRGHPDRGHLPHPGAAALRRLPRQRLRTLADPRRRRTCRSSTPTSPPRPNHSLEDGDRPTSGPTCATRTPWPARGRSRAPPGSSTASVASRRATGTATSPTTPPTTTSWSAPARPRSTGSPTPCPRWSSTTPSGQAKVLVLGWGSTYGPIGAGCTPGPQGRLPRRAGPPAPPQPVPQRPRRDPRPLRQGPGPRDEPRPALHAAARAVPRRRRRLQPGQRHAAQGRRPRRRDR